MPRYLIELTHEDEHTACVKVLRAIERYGAHLLIEMDWGCKTGIHSGWLIAEVDSRAFGGADWCLRSSAKKPELSNSIKFTREEIVSLIAELEENS